MSHQRAPHSPEALTKRPLTHRIRKELKISKKSKGSTSVLFIALFLLCVQTDSIQFRHEDNAFLNYICRMWIPC